MLWTYKIYTMKFGIYITHYFKLNIPRFFYLKTNKFAKISLFMVFS